MKAQKVTVNIKVETLSPDSVYSVLIQMAKQFSEAEIRNGSLIAEDGDSVVWSTITKNVEF